MPSKSDITVAQLVRNVPTPVRPIVQAARRTIKGSAPKAEEIVYMAEPPRSKTYMWKILRYTAGGANVVGIGTFAKHSAIFFYRGRELDDGSGLLQGSGTESRFISLRTPADAERPAVKRILRNAFKLGASGSGR
jgi:hypothetical protein